MDNEKFQGLVLEQLGSLGNRMDRFEKGQQQLVVGQQQLEQRQQQLENGQQQLENGQRSIWACLDTIVLNQSQMLQDIQTIISDVANIRQSQVRVEQNHSEKIKALFDFRDSQIETNKNVASRLDRLEAKP